MRVIEGRNVNETFQKGIIGLNAHGRRQASRNGETLEFPTPVTSVYRNPTERVLFDPVRDANPFFHLHESLWMLDGRNDVASLALFNKRMAEYSDDGITFHGAYGYRWRQAFKKDQLTEVVTLLQRDPDSRRAVVQIWDADLDLGKQGKDFPCNTAVYFKIRDGLLNMTVCNRSNDMIWGAYGANVVHFSMLQEYMAAMIGCDVGVYYQVSDSLHAYETVFAKVRDRTAFGLCPYDTGEVTPQPLVEHPAEFDEDLEHYLSTQGYLGYANPFFLGVAEPMRMAWMAWKRKDLPAAFGHAHNISATDWRKAAVEWLQRRVR